MRFVSFCNTTIRFLFYGIFLFVPLIFVSDTSELFEFNKMWLTFILTILIGATWISKMIFQRRVIVQRTPLDIPLLLFLLSQIISTIFSLDRHVSWWGYYSRFNGGLASTIAYIFLYYAFTTNIENPIKTVATMLKVSLVSGLIVSLWGLPSHFGYDPTCLLFRGTFDVSCWTDAFQPKVRIFSTMGQPDWLAAYLLILIPVAMYFGLIAYRKRKYILSVAYFLLTSLFYLDLLYTRSKGGFIAFVLSLPIFFVGYIFLTQEKSKKYFYLAGLAVVFVAITFFADSPFAALHKFSFNGISEHFQQVAQTQPTSKETSKQQAQPAPAAPVAVGELGGTDSGKIRSYVWKGAIDAWLHNMLFGTGVETFAFAYYRYRPAAHNLTSEWDYLYNKAHNEYLNYLTTTGAFGLLTYLGFIGLFLFLGTKELFLFVKKQKEMKVEVREKMLSSKLLILSLGTGFLTIIISNFFGFSVVIVNVYLILLPLFALIVNESISKESVLRLPNTESPHETTHYFQKFGIGVSYLFAVYLIIVLINYWFADKAYGLGNNLDKIGQYQMAYESLHQAVASRPDEPVFKDELAVNDAYLAVGYAQQKDLTNANRLVEEAITISDDLTTNHPNYLIFWKSRVRIMYNLAQIDGRFLSPAVTAIEKAHELAPTDAKISYNMALLYGQAGELDKAVSALRETVRLKPDYRDAYYALALLLHQQAVNKDNVIIDPAKEKEAVDTLHFILTNIAPSDAPVKESLKSWGEK